ncbi:MAG: hypothetical protein ACFFC3_16575 [Candidatus Odinarchaeota archaeon]
MDTSKSEKIVNDYFQYEPKYKRKIHTFSGTFDTTPEKIFPLLCPAREADWIPGWDCKLIYTESGYAEDKCIFQTGKSNHVGEGLWTFTGYQLNEYVEFVLFQQDVLTHSKINITQNKDGTSTTTWTRILTALSEEGNKKIDSLPVGDDNSNPIIEMIDHYLKKGKHISKLSLNMKMAHSQH